MPAHRATRQSLRRRVRSPHIPPRFIRTDTDSGPDNYPFASFFDLHIPLATPRALPDSNEINGREIFPKERVANGHQGNRRRDSQMATSYLIQPSRSRQGKGNSGGARVGLALRNRNSAADCANKGIQWSAAADGFHEARAPATNSREKAVQRLGKEVIRCRTRILRQKNGKRGAGAHIGGPALVFCVRKVATQMYGYSSRKRLVHGQAFGRLWTSVEKSRVGLAVALGPRRMTSAS